jgi:hypothetical protein
VFVDFVFRQPRLGLLDDEGSRDGRCGVAVVVPDRRRGNPGYADLYHALAAEDQVVDLRRRHLT